jgi:hypothetical protein
MNPNQTKSKQTRSDQTNFKPNKSNQIKNKSNLTIPNQANSNYFNSINAYTVKNANWENSQLAN